MCGAGENEKSLTAAAEAGITPAEMGDVEFVYRGCDSCAENFKC